MENRLEVKGTGILDLANLYLREKTSHLSKQDQKSLAEDILAKLQEEGDIDEYLQVHYWKDPSELKEKLLRAIMSAIEEDTKETFPRGHSYDLLKKISNEVESNLELAYAISVHKSQGSEFDRVYFVLPKNKSALLSTELTYTGITRAQKHLTILAEQDVSVFMTLRRPEKSHLLAINSSLFAFRPIPDEMLQIRSWYEEGKIHQTLADYMVRSKSEVIIANMLFDRKIPFKYEMPLFAPDGTFYIPDFTLTWNGEQWYWEHLGLMDREDYRNHWQTKWEWYEKHFPGRIVTTTESGTLSKEAESIINKYFS